MNTFLNIILRISLLPIFFCKHLCALTDLYLFFNSYLETSLSFMKFNMLPKLYLSWKALFALVTLERSEYLRNLLLSWMPSHMISQMSLCCEGFLAFINGTYVRPFTCMNSHVSFEISFLCEFLSANIADIWLFTCLNVTYLSLHEFSCVFSIFLTLSSFSRNLSLCRHMVFRHCESTCEYSNAL